MAPDTPLHRPDCLHRKLLFWLASFCACVAPALGGHIQTTQDADIAAVSEVVIYSKSAPPFSMPYGDKDNVTAVFPSCDIGSSDDCPVHREAYGLTIDYVVGSNGLLAQINSTVRWERMASVIMLDGVDDSTGAAIGGNYEIFQRIQSDHCNPAVNPHRLCIGAAAISITPERESYLEFFVYVFHLKYILLYFIVLKTKG